MNSVPLTPRTNPTDLRAQRLWGVQRSRDFELGQQRLRLFSPVGSTVQFIASDGPRR